MIDVTAGSNLFDQMSQLAQCKIIMVVSCKNVNTISFAMSTNLPDYLQTQLASQHHIS